MQFTRVDVLSDNYCQHISYQPCKVSTILYFPKPQITPREIISLKPRITLRYEWGTML